MHPRVHPHHSPLLDPGIAEALAALLDVLAGQIERGTEAIDPQTRLTAVSLARTANCADPSPSAAGRSCARSPSVNTNSASTRSPRDIPKPSQQVQGPPPGGTHTASTLEPHDPLLKGSSAAGRARCITRSRPSWVLRPYLPGFRRFTLEFMTQTRQEPEEELKSDIVG